jgi:general L-amino acid transport system substrate-binding protein
MPSKLLTAAVAAGLVLIAGLAGAATLDDVKERGLVRCGVHTGLPGFGEQDAAGAWSGLDVDYCRAVAAAIFNDPKAVEFVPLSTKDRERFVALRSAKIDLLARNTTWTMSLDTAQGMTFTGVNYYDGQAFMVKKGLGIISALELSGATICVQSGTTTELNLADFFAVNSMTYTPVVVDNPADAVVAYESGRCDVYTSDASGLYALRLTLADPYGTIVLPEIISKEPLSPVVRQGDDQWFDIVKWVGFALINAEELGVTAANVDKMRSNDNQEIRRLLGTDGTFGEDIGLTNDWAANAIKAVGNYGEIFDRNIGSGSDLQIARGLNALWVNGGILYAPPIR